MPISSASGLRDSSSLASASMGSESVMDTSGAYAPSWPARAAAATGSRAQMMSHHRRRAPRRGRRTTRRLSGVEVDSPGCGRASGGAQKGGLPAQEEAYSVPFLEDSHRRRRDRPDPDGGQLLG